VAARPLRNLRRIGDVLVKQGTRDEALASYQEALAIAKMLPEADKTNARKSEPNSKSGEIASIAYEFELAGDFAKALEAADLAISLAPDETWIYINRAHALTFLGRVDEARTIYLQHRGEKSFDVIWEMAVLRDFVELRKAGYMHPLMDEIEKPFAKKK
jgi:tetratricopeptide (TPR) repeat protein